MVEVRLLGDCQIDGAVKEPRCDRSLCPAILLDVVINGVIMPVIGQVD